MNRYSIHGLRIRSALALSAPGQADTPGTDTTGTAPTDDVVVAGVLGGPVGRLPPAGQLMLQADLLWPLSIVRTSAQTIVVHYSDHVAFTITPGAPVRIDTVVADDADAPMAAILLQGLVLAVVVELCGSFALHGTAIDSGDGSVALIGPSGSGKTTIAGLACLGGARLVADDVVVPRISSDGEVRVHPGLSELRFRPNGEPIAEALPGAASRTTADGRRATRPRLASGPSTLRAIYLAVPDRATTTVRTETVDEIDALMVLLANTRVPGWQDPELVQRQFSQVGDLVSRVPVALLRVPWTDEWTTERAIETARMLAPVLRNPHPH